MSEFINTADVIGDDQMCDQIIMRTLTEYRENRITKIGKFILSHAASLEVVDVPNVSFLAQYALYKSAALTALVLRYNTVATLENTNALGQSGIANGTGYIYVPSDLVDSYKSATNWSTYANQFRALEDYTVDGSTDGELDASKI